jgi:hypothetical protein
MARRPAKLTANQTAIVATYARQLPEHWRSEFVRMLQDHLGEDVSDHAVQTVAQAAFIAIHVRIGTGTEASP